MLSDLIKVVQAHYQGKEADAIGLVLVSAISEIDRRLSALEARPDLARVLEQSCDIFPPGVIEPRAVGQSRRSASLDAVARLEAEIDVGGGRRDLSDGTFPSCPSCGRAHQDCGRRVGSGHDAAMALADQIRGGLEEGIRAGSTDPTQPIPWPSELTTSEQAELVGLSPPVAHLIRSIWRAQNEEQREDGAGFTWRRIPERLWIDIGQAAGSVVNTTPDTPAARLKMLEEAERAYLLAAGWKQVGCGVWNSRAGDYDQSEAIAYQRAKDSEP